WPTISRRASTRRKTAPPSGGGVDEEAMRAMTTRGFQLPRSRPKQLRRIMLQGNRYTVSTLEVAGTVNGRSWGTLCESSEKAARAVERHIARFLREGYVE